MIKNIVYNFIKKEYKFKYLFFSVISGVLLALSFPKFNVFIFAWVSFIPLLYCIFKSNIKHSLIYGFITGLIFNIISVYWIFLFLLNNSNRFFSSMSVAIILWVYLSIYFAVWAVSVNILKRYNSLIVILFSSSLWIFLEFIKSYLFTGFQINLLGYSQSSFILLIQIADIAGIYGVSFIIILINIMLFYRIYFTNKKFSIFIILITICLFIYGFVRMNKFDMQYGSKITVGIVQTKEYKEKKVYYQENVVKQIYKSIENIKNKDMDIILYPETLVLGDLEKDKIIKDMIKEISLLSDINLIGGTLSIHKNNYNSIFIISRKGEILDVYRKKHLVVFGEYLPFRKGLLIRFLSSLNKFEDRTHETELKVFHFDKYTIGISICSENFYPSLSREFVLKGATILTNHTNNSWFKDPTLPYQHFSMNVFRAVENRKNVLISANSGISGIIDASGRTVEKIKEDESLSFISNAYTNNYITIYDKIGDIFVYMCMFFSLICLFFAIFAKITKRI